MIRSTLTIVVDGKVEQDITFDTDVDFDFRDQALLAQELKALIAAVRRDKTREQQAAIAAYADGFAAGADSRPRIANLDPALLTHWDRGRYDGAAAAKKALDAYPERMRWEAEIARRNREADRG